MENSTNGLSIAGFIVSLGSMFIGFYGIVGLAGIVLSAVGLNQAKNEGGKKGLAVAGIILGIIGAGYNWINMFLLAA